ncbi:hypothetical protein BTO20_37865 (plasmid) [Mycobacterium dioxanotrophicus]|jgi:hypothetical protein|uniref:Uncharacterized protein n=1 Tax=Mycobacterium dioxanotrophicus TaxID=482462 RepID=A0A1Y0CGI1_9MYCO|nr:hypothetical protein [Mycobacterium dioxanotrophicus]ART74389.1 hypothetical protein BTO20_37865 [Mycobacterium dioxanotrophicus]
MELPQYPQPIEVASNDRSITVGVNAWGQPTGVQLTEDARRLAGAELAARIKALYEIAKTAALAVHNVEHHRETKTWMPSWPTANHVETLLRGLTF